MIWLATALAADPLLDGLPPGAEIVRGPVTWTVRAGGQSVVVPAPRTPQDEAEVRALAASLLSTLDLAAEVPIPDLPPAPRPPPPAPRPVPPPAPVLPAPVVAEALEAPAPPRAPAPVAGWIGVDAALRPGVGPGAGLAVGGAWGERLGLGGWIGARLPRPLALTGAPALWEAEIAAEGWGNPVPWLVVAGGVGGALRRYTLDGDGLATHLVPRAHLRLAVPIAAQPLRVELGAGVDVDLGATWVGPASDQALLSPVAARLGTRIAPARRAP